MPNFERSAVTRLLVSYLSETNGFVSYARLSDHVHEPIDGRDPHLQSARRILEKEPYGQVWATVRGEGVRLLKDEEVTPMERDKTVGAIRRRAKRSLTRLATVNIDNLQPAERVAWVTQSTWAHFVSEAARERSIKKIESKANANDAKEIPMALVLESLQNSKRL